MPAQPRGLLIVLAGWLAAAPAPAAMDALTADGEAVILHEDFTWEYRDRNADADTDADTGDDSGAADDLEAGSGTPGVAAPAVLTVSNRRELNNACRFGFTLTNHLPDRIKSIVPQFLAFTANEVMFQRKFQAFSDIRPTMRQYKEVQFDGIRCEDIAYLHMTGADHCEIGELTKFSSTSALCLARVTIEPSPLVEIRKVVAEP